jgi:hypothetical protein
VTFWFWVLLLFSPRISLRFPSLWPPFLSCCVWLRFGHLGDPPLRLVACRFVNHLLIDCD